MTLTWSTFCNQENIIWSRKTLYSNFRINNCFCQIPLQSIFEVLFKLISDDFTFNKFVFRTRASLLLSSLRSKRYFFCSRPDVLDELARKRLLRRLAFVWVTCIITHMSRRKPFKCKPPEVHFTIKNRVPHNKQLTNRACSSRTWLYWPWVVAKRTSTALALS